jgi:hypothetical protein
VLIASSSTGRSSADGLDDGEAEMVLLEVLLPLSISDTAALVLHDALSYSDFDVVAELVCEELMVEETDDARDAVNVAEFDVEPDCDGDAL